VSTNDVSKIKVVIIDKHEAVRRALRIRLSVTEHLEVVGTFADPRSAEQLLRSARPDVIVMGLHSATDEELFLTAMAVREMTDGPAVVIVLAPYADVMERELLLGAGAKRYLLKHINSNYLIHEIEAVAPHWANTH
jgi:DNA-binding NarL/FixJ family response regulator